MDWIRDDTLRHDNWLSRGGNDKQLDTRSSTNLLEVNSESVYREAQNMVLNHERKRLIREPFQHQGLLSVFNFNLEERTKLVDRKQTRILAETRGRGLKHFRSLEELLWVFHDAIDDHKQFYHRGVLHRNISPGSIIILNPLKDGKTGQLIDLDHAKMNKHVEETRQLFKYNPTEDVLRSKGNALRTDLAEGIPMMKKKSIFADELTVTAAVKACGPRTAILYLETIVERLELSSSEQQQIELSDLHWDLPVKNPPFFEDYSAGDGICTGTAPYTSHQIVARMPVVHDAIHDIESFFWVMVHIALTRAGPGAKNGNPPNALLDFYFDDKRPDALASVKGRIFSIDDKIAKASMEELFKHFHAYFEDLKPFIEKWQKVIQTAYQFKAFEFNVIHEYTKTLIKEAISRLELTQKEDDRRGAAESRGARITCQPD